MITGTDLRTHLAVGGEALCGAVDEVASLILTVDVAVVTCSGCLSGIS